MALDEVLLASADARPTLRFYSWRPHALSLGYFQRWAELAPRAAGSAVVRRFSGGGAIHHADELTFSIAAPLAHPLYRGEVARSYERVHALLAAAFAELGVHAELRGARALASERAGTGMCFHESTPLDLVWDERKGVGSAQRRKGERVLHHGSIKLGRTALEEGVAALRDHVPGIDAATLAHAIARAFERGARCRFECLDPDDAERSAASERAPFYSSTEFVRRR